jgi:hypothetical protein
MADTRPRRHFAFAVTPARGGFKVSSVLEYPTRGEAEKAMLTLVGRHGDADVVTLDRELVNGEVLAATILRRPPR